MFIYVFIVVLTIISIITIYFIYIKKNKRIFYNGVDRYPIILISIFACNRYNYLNQTLNAFYSHLYNYEKEINYNTLYFDQGTVEREEVIKKYNIKNSFLFNPSGMELSFDILFSYLYTEYVFLLEEDWVVDENVEKEIFYPSFILESILILNKTNKVYGVVVRETDHFQIHETINVTTKMGKHTLYIGLLKLGWGYTNGATIYKSIILKEIAYYPGEAYVSKIFLSKGYKLGFTYKGRNGSKDDIHIQHVMDHIGFRTSKSAICSVSLY